MTAKTKKPLPIIGWREWVGLPELEISWIKAKVDTGARSSSIHTFDLHPYEQDGEDWVRFKIHPIQRNTKVTVTAEAKVIDVRSVRSSSGKASKRPVILSHITMLGTTWPIELTLANRDEMGFRMLLGREAFRNRFLVDAGGSYYGRKPESPKRQKRNRSRKSAN